MASTAHPEPYIVHPSRKHTHTIILLHGTSTTGPSFASSFLAFPIPYPTSPQSPTEEAERREQTATPLLLPSLLPTTRFVFPTGRLAPSTIFNGELKNAWFDILSFSDRTLNEHLQAAGLRDSCRYLEELISAESTLVGGAENVFLGGFSQGSAMSIFFLLSGYLNPLIGGVVGMSGWLPFRKQIHESADLGAFMAETVGGRAFSEVSKDIPVWLAQGFLDTKVIPTWAEEMRDVLLAEGRSVGYSVYEGLGHWYGEEEMLDLVAFLKQHGVVVEPPIL
ncbi:phospholipase/Carboxylesterase [Phlyctema vagabunda]|uniref:Phospholipase/Carboxylesterase n=1 Tax=Phlyctema vagabunda TaxID=108571 RepID=A0ABR4P951_9HELO